MFFLVTHRQKALLTAHNRGSMNEATSPERQWPP
jgi:hypothetical protein